jgi:membrane fusion protein, multidrug efflux system
VARKDVEANNSLGNNWIVTHGLNDGDQIIVTGVQIAREGTQVKAVAYQPPPGAASDAAAASGAAAAPAESASAPAAAATSAPAASAASASSAQ